MNNNFMSDRPGFYQEMSIANASITNNESDEIEPGPSTAPIEKEHMFDKVVTPSDVGKLNRLVIPKQHAEKYFPLDSSTNEKGLLLNFEDRNGKPWRFRYSYWNSSQSYVMTKGWSRFVKEKKLDAGDIVSFQRGVGDKDRLFIDWRRRPDAPDLLPSSLPNHFSTFQYNNRLSNANPWNPLFVSPHSTRDHHYVPYYNHLSVAHPHQYQNQSQYGNIGYNNNTTVVNGNPCPPGSIFYLSRPGGTGSGSGGGGGGSGFIVAGRPQEGVVQNEQMVYESVPVVQGKAAAKRLRLFGVNMDCPIQESDECDEMLSNTVPLQQYFPASTTSSSPTTSASSSFPKSLQFMRPNYNDNDDKGKGSMSLDLDI